MSTHKNNISDNASYGIANGINICRKSVEKTIGGKGTNAIIKQAFYPYYIQTKDAFSIIQAIKCEDPLEALAVDMMKDATDSMNKRSKDGRTTMCILTDEILQNAQKCTESNVDWEKELTSLLPEIEKSIDEQTRPITVDEVEAVARTASDSERLGKLIAGVYKSEGKDCIINHIEASGTFEDSVVIHRGVRFMDTGFLSPEMVHDEEAKKDNRTQKRAVYENPHILVTKRKITKDADIAPLVQALIDGKKNHLVIFTDDMDSNVATSLVNTHKARIMNICIVKAPVLWKTSVFEDFAKVTGSTIVEDATGVTFENLSLSHLGTCGRIVIDREETTITGGADISEHIADLKTRDDEESKIRIWYLNSKQATLRLGATNEGELSFLRLKAEDAVHSSQLALQGGVVAGGGVCLLNVSRKVSNEVLKKSLIAPIEQIMKNTGLPVSSLLTNGAGGTIGMDAKTGTLLDMFEAGIVDSAIVQKNAIRNAIGIALRALTTSTFIDLPKRTTEDLQLEILANSRGRGM